MICCLYVLCVALPGGIFVVYTYIHTRQDILQQAAPLYIMDPYHVQFLLRILFL